MKRLLLMTALALTACAPALTGPADVGGAQLTVVRGEAFDTVRFEAGTQEVTAATLTLTGRDLRVNDVKCAAQGPQIVCALGALPAGRTYLLPVRGLLIVEAEFTRPDAQRHYLITER